MEKVHAGKLLGSTEDCISGKGTYTYLKGVYASQTGFVNIDKSQGDKSIISVERTNQSEKKNDSSQQTQSNIESNVFGQPKIGNLVYARITRVEPNFVKAEILAIENQPLKTVFQGILFKENVRTYDIDNLELLKCFRPNDIIRARVISEQGAGNQMSTLLSTVEDENGVVFARSENSGALMIPCTWNDFMCVKSKKKEKRKVAKPDVIGNSNNEEGSEAMQIDQ
eukprot:403376905